jgi:hypothetical protein
MAENGPLRYPCEQETLDLILSESSVEQAARKIWREERLDKYCGEVSENWVFDSR